MGAVDGLIRLGALAAVLWLAWAAWSRARTMPGERGRILFGLGLIVLTVALLAAGTALVTEHPPHAPGHELGVWFAWAGMLLLGLLLLYAIGAIIAAALRRR